MPRRASFQERVEQFRQCLADGRIRPDENYSVHELATILGWDISSVKLVIPAIVSARNIPESLSWEKKQVGNKNFYSFRVTSKILL